MARAAGRGLAVCKPWGDSLRYDFVVETEGGFLRVQVKSTIHHRGSRGYLCKVQPHRKVTQYTGLEFDFLALYVIPEDVWYIVPSRAALTRATTSIYLSPSIPGRRYERYKKGGAASPARARCCTQVAAQSEPGKDPKVSRARPPVRA